MKKTLLILTLFIAGQNALKATTWETVSLGYWNEASIWSAGLVPDTSSSDTFIIKHPIVISTDLILQAGALMSIEDGGGICGHQKATVLSGAELVTYGILELDELYVTGGFVGCYGGKTHLTTSAKVSQIGARMHVDSTGLLKVGVWFDCVQPDYSFTIDQTLGYEESEIAQGISIFPNPFTKSIDLEYPHSTGSKPANIIIQNLQGREVYKINFTADARRNIDLSFLPDGIYFLNISNDVGVLTKKIIKQ